MFGRLDFDDGETYHIGRLGVRDEDREPLLIDWRAPAAAPFYRATPGEPLGVVRRRVIICRGPEGRRPRRRRAVPDEAGDLRVRRRGGAAGRAAPVPRARTCATSSPRSSASRTRRSGRRPGASPSSPAARDRQDPGRAAPRRVPALHRPGPVRRRPHPGGRPVDGVHRRTSAGCCPALGEDSVHLRAIGELVEGVTATRRDRAAGGRDQGQRADAGGADRAGVADPAERAATGCGWCTRARCSRWRDDLAQARAGSGPRPRRPARSPTRPGHRAAVLLDALWSKVDGAPGPRRCSPRRSPTAPSSDGSSPRGGRR